MGAGNLTAPNVVLATGGPGELYRDSFIHTNVSARWGWRWRKV